jgi:multidrug efflux system membrane fusion protein
MKRHSPSWGDSTGRTKAVALVVLFALAVFGVIAHLASGNRQEPNRKIQAAPVTIAEAIQKDIPVELRAIGRVEPYARVTIKARVNGELQRIHFQEGQSVKVGDLLFTIDPAAQ